MRRLLEAVYGHPRDDNSTENGGATISDVGSMQCGSRIHEYSSTLVARVALLFRWACAAPWQLFSCYVMAYGLRSISVLFPRFNRDKGNGCCSSELAAWRVPNPVLHGWCKGSLPRSPRDIEWR